MARNLNNELCKYVLSYIKKPLNHHFGDITVKPFFMSYKYVLSCVLDFQEFPTFFLHMKGSTAPLCMHLNPNPILEVINSYSVQEVRN